MPSAEKSSELHVPSSGMGSSAAYSAPKRSKTRAQSLVEFALVGPLFFLLLLGVIEGGRLMFVDHELANGTKEGARYAMVHGSKSGSAASSASVKTAMMAKMTGVNSGALNVSLSGGTDPGQTGSITTTYTFTPIVSMVFGTGSITIRHTSQYIIQH